MTQTSGYKANLKEVDELVDLLISAQTDGIHEKVDSDASKKALNDFATLIQRCEELSADCESLRAQNLEMAKSVETLTILSSHAHALILSLSQERDLIATELETLKRLHSR